MVPNAQLVNKLSPASDEVLIARLRDLGYTTDLPATATEAEEDPADESRACGGDANEATRFARYRANAPSLLEKLLASREAEVSQIYHSL